MKRFLVAVLAVAAMAFLFGCSGSNATPTPSPTPAPSPAVTVSVTPASAQTIDQNQTVSITASVANDAANKGVTWSVSGLGTLASQTATSVVYTAPTTVSSSQKATVTATSVADTSKTATVSITVDPAPAITTTSLPSATVGTAYNQTLAYTGGTGTGTWAVSAGTLPAGLTLNASTGAISGTPTATGTSNFTVSVTDTAKVAATEALSIAVSPAAALAITTTSLPNGSTGAAYSQTLQATGGVQPYSWTIASGALPQNLQLSSAGVISGTPGASGSFSFTVQVSDAENPAVTATQVLTIDVTVAALTITTTSLPNATVGSAYSSTLQASGGVQPYTWSVTSGSLPSWATLNASTGAITGTPGATDTGKTSFTVGVSDAESPAASATQALSITAASAQSGMLNGQYAILASAYNTAFAASITTDGAGAVTGGVEDIKAASAAAGANVAITGGSYSIGSDNRGTLTYTDANGNTFSFAIALGAVSNGVASKGQLIETDNTFELSGTLQMQDASAFSTAALTGPYVFGFAGGDSTSPINILGVFTADGSGNFTNGQYDANDGGTLTTAQSLTGTYSSPDSNGRVTYTMPGQGTGVLYVVNASKWFAINSITTGNGVVAGQIRQQSGGPFGASSLNGNLILTGRGENGVPAGHAMLGIISISNLNASISADENDGGSVSTLSASGTFSVPAANGRFTLSVPGASSMVAYLIASNRGVMTDSTSRPDFDTFEPQSAGPFSNSYMQGSYFLGTLPVLAPTAQGSALKIQSGVLTLNNGTVTGTEDTNSSGTVGTGAISGTYSVDATGRVTVSGGNVVLYVVSPSKLYLLDISSNPNPTIQIIEQ